MAIPPLKDYGLLPPGIHECTLDEVRLLFVTDDSNFKRWELLLAFINWIHPLHFFKSIYIGGSFITDKEDPNDIDIVLEIPSPDPKLLQSFNEKVFDHNYIKNQFKLDVYLWWSDAPGDMRLFFQYIKPDECMRHGLNLDTKKGILKVII